MQQHFPRIPGIGCSPSQRIDQREIFATSSQSPSRARRTSATIGSSHIHRRMHQRSVPCPLAMALRSSHAERPKQAMTVKLLEDETTTDSIKRGA